MKLTTVKEIDEFLAILDSCKGDVILTSPYGDRFNLKSKLSQYVAVAELLGENADDLELWCDYKGDEVKFFDFLGRLKK